MSVLTALLLATGGLHAAPSEQELIRAARQEARQTPFESLYEKLNNYIELSQDSQSEPMEALLSQLFIVPDLNDARIGKILQLMEKAANRAGVTPGAKELEDFRARVLSFRNGLRSVDAEKLPALDTALDHFLTNKISYWTRLSVAQKETFGRLALATLPNSVSQIRRDFIALAIASQLPEGAANRLYKDLQISLLALGVDANSADTVLLLLKNTFKRDQVLYFFEPVTGTTLMDVQYARFSEKLTTDPMPAVREVVDRLGNQRSGMRQQATARCR